MKKLKKIKKNSRISWKNSRILWKNSRYQSIFATRYSEKPWKKKPGLGTAVGALYQVEWAGCKIVVTATSESAVLSWADRWGLRLHQLQARCRANIWDCQSPHPVPSKVPKVHNEKQKYIKFGIPGNAGRVPLVTYYISPWTCLNFGLNLSYIF